MNSHIKIKGGFLPTKMTSHKQIEKAEKEVVQLHNNLNFTLKYAIKQHDIKK